MVIELGTLALGEGFVWGLIVIIGVGNFCIRFLPIPVMNRIELSPLVETGLGLIPAAVLAALVFPNVIRPDGQLVATLLDPRFVAGGAAAVTAWRTDNMVATIGVGMAILWGLQFLLG